MEMGWSDCFYDTVGLEPFYRWRGSSLSVCYSVLHGLKGPGAHTLPTMPRGRIQAYWGLPWLQDLGRAPLGGSQAITVSALLSYLHAGQGSGMPGWRVGATLHLGRLGWGGPHRGDL